MGPSVCDHSVFAANHGRWVTVMNELCVWVVCMCVFVKQAVKFMKYIFIFFQSLCRLFFHCLNGSAVYVVFNLGFILYKSLQTGNRHTSILLVNRREWV